MKKLLLSALLLCPAAVFAQTDASFTLDSLGSGSPEVQAFFNEHPYFDAVGDPEGNYASPYPAVVQIGSSNFNVVAACLDYNNGGYIGQTYQGSFLTDFSQFTTAQKESSWLLDTYQSILLNAVNNQLQASALSDAIWDLNEPGETPIPSITRDGINTLIGNYEGQAIAAVNAGYVADNAIWQPVGYSPNGGYMQSFMLLPGESASLGLVSVAAPGAPAPPMTACLAFAGVLVLQALRSRKVTL